MPKSDRLKLKTNEVNHSSYRYYKWQSQVARSSCALCWHGRHDTPNIKLEAHHIYPMALYPKLSFDPDNGISLCSDCHKKVHSMMKTGAITSVQLIEIRNNYKIALKSVFQKQLDEMVAKYA